MARVFWVEGTKLFPFYDDHNKLVGCYDYPDETEFTPCKDCLHYQKCDPWIVGSGIEWRNMHEN